MYEKRGNAVAVYIDILIFLNTVITYLILLATEKLSRLRSRIYRLIISSLIGGFLSLYILLPQQSVLIEFTVKSVFGAVIILTAFKVASFKIFLRALITFLFTSFLYAGSMFALWYIIKPENLLINNGIVYFSVSPIVLLTSSAVCYLILRFLQVVLKPSDKYARKKEIFFSFKDKTVSCVCLVDTGCSICDSFGNSKIAIISRRVADELFGEKNATAAISMFPPEDFVGRFRIVPYKTLSENGIMPAIAVDYALVGGRKLSRVLVCISKNQFDNDFEGIVSPGFIDEGDN